MSRVGIDFKTVGVLNTKIVYGKSHKEIVEIIFDSINQIYEVSRVDIFGYSRLKEVREGRQIAHYLMRKFTSLSLIQIGRETNNNHSSVIHSLKVVAQDLSDKVYRSTLEAIEVQVRLKIKK